MKKVTTGLLALAVFLLAGGSVLGAALLPWQDHAAPYSFLFGNHIDTHQQSRIIDRQLQGYFYIQYTGTYTADGVPEAMIGDCTADPDSCVAGWTFKAVPVEATLISVGSGEHPTWCVEPKDLPRRGGYSHFHWLGLPEHDGGLIVGETYEGYLLQLRAVDTFFLHHHGGFLVTPGIDNYSLNNLVTGCD